MGKYHFLETVLPFSRCPGTGKSCPAARMRFFYPVCVYSVIIALTLTSAVWYNKCRKSVGGAVMSSREYAIGLISMMTDEQVDNLVNFIVSLSGVRVSEKNDDELQSKRRSFEKLNRMIRSVPIEDDKKVLQEYRDERYGI